MILIGLNRSPYIRRVAIRLNIRGMRYEHKALSGFSNRQEVRAWNPLGGIPAPVLDNCEVLINSSAIIDHLDDVRGGGPACVTETYRGHDGHLRKVISPHGGADERPRLFHRSL